jgi:hypothetical protein
MPTPPPDPAWPVYAALSISGVSLLVAVCGFFITNRLAIKRDTAAKLTSRKLDFRVSISQIRARINIHDVATFYRETKSEVRSEIAKINPVLSAKEFRPLEELWLECDSIDTDQRLNQQYEDYEWERDCKKAVEGTDNSPPKPSDVLKEYFDRFSNLAK